MLSTGDVIDRYTVEGEIASGGMAEVYRVRHQQLGSVHALKVLVLRTQDIKRRLLQEGRVQAALKHPNAIMVTDVVEVGGHPGLVMEFVDGPTLGDWVHLDNPGFPEIERVFREVVSAIGEAHRVGLIHRDLKPSNVLMARAGEKRIAKVIDFGLAKVVQDDDMDHTRSGVPMGTPSYMAPEQIADAKNVDVRADLFSLGALLYYMVCRKKAFDGGNAVETYNAVLGGEYTPPLEIRPDIPANLVRAIDVCLRTNREERVRSAEDLLAILDGAEVEGLVPEPPRELGPLMRRVAVAGFVIGVLGAGAFVVSGGPAAWRPSGTGGRVTVEPPSPVPVPVIATEPGEGPVRTELSPTGLPPTHVGPAPSDPCAAETGTKLGYARVPARAKRDESWVLDQPTPLFAAPNGARTPCTLPAGTSILVTEKPIKEGGDHWLAVVSGKFGIP